MKKHYKPFLSFWLLNSLLLYVAYLLYPFYFSLGNSLLSVFWAAVFAGFVWTLLAWLGKPILGSLFKTKSKLIMFAFYFLANFVALWATARFASIVGFGTTSFVWLVFLALLGNIFQYGVWKLGGFKKAFKSKK